MSQAFLTAQEKEAQELAALELQQRLEELLRKNEEAAKSQNKDDEEMVENLFGFMSTLGGQEGQAPEGFEVRVILTAEGHLFDRNKHFMIKIQKACHLLLSIHNKCTHILHMLSVIILYTVQYSLRFRNAK